MNQDYRTRHLLSGGMCINEATGCKLRVEQDDGERRFVLYDRHGNGTRLPYPVTPAGAADALDELLLRGETA